MCDECNINPANVHLTQIVKDEVTVQHICEKCAKKKGISIVIEEDKSSLQIAAEEQKQEHKAERKRDKKIACSVCGMTFAEFKEKGLLGCSSCYNAFEKEIDNLLIQVHGSSQHRGKMYSISHASRHDKDEVTFLRNELENAIRNEKFELAAAIRDKINSVSSHKSSGGAKD